MWGQGRANTNLLKLATAIATVFAHEAVRPSGSASRCQEWESPEMAQQGINAGTARGQFRN